MTINQQFLSLAFISQFLIFSVTNLSAQCIADAGENTIICAGGHEGPDTTIIGGMPSVTGGVPPYTFIWETNNYLAGTNFSASYFLNDSTLANPKLTSGGSAWDDLSFLLIVEDAIGNVCIDSVNLEVSSFVYPITDYFGYIDQGDSIVLLHSVFGGVEPFSFSWQPTENLLDPTAEFPIAFPDTTTIYTVVITDAAGCTTQSPDPNEVYVTTTNTKNLNDLDTGFRLFPNPNYGLLNIDFESSGHETLRIIFYDITGRKILEEMLYGEKSTVKLGHIDNRSILFYQILNPEGQSLKSGNILIR